MSAGGRARKGHGTTRTRSVTTRIRGGTCPVRYGYALRSCGIGGARHRLRGGTADRVAGITRSCRLALSASASRRSSASRAMRRSAVTMSHGSAADTSLSAEAADVARRSQCPSSPCASRSRCSSSAVRRASASDRAITARRHLSTLHDTASASAGATSMRTANGPGVSMGSSGVEDARALYAPAYTRDTGKIARGLRSVVRVVYVCRQSRTPPHLGLLDDLDLRFLGSRMVPRQFAAPQSHGYFFSSASSSPPMRSYL